MPHLRIVPAPPGCRVFSGPISSGWDGSTTTSVLSHCHHDFVVLGQLEIRMFGGGPTVDFGNGPQGIFRMGSAHDAGYAPADGALQ